MLPAGTLLALVHAEVSQMIVSQMLVSQMLVSQMIASQIRTLVCYVRLATSDERLFNNQLSVQAQLYYNVTDVRTQDDAMLKIKLMVFYHMDSIDQMLDSTSDPIGDFSNAVCADVIRFASEYTFEEFLQHTNSLNDLATFPVLVQRAHAVGFLIDKVVFRGYKASEHLQKVRWLNTCLRLRMVLIVMSYRSTGLRRCNSDKGSYATGD